MTEQQTSDSTESPDKNEDAPKEETIDDSPGTGAATSNPSQEGADRDNDEVAGKEDRETDDDATLWGMSAHLASLAGFIGIPLGNIIGPLVVWLIKKDEMEFVDEQGKEALNFQISMTIYAIVSALTIMLFIGIILLPIVILADLILTIVAAINARDGNHYQYPLTIRFIK